MHDTSCLEQRCLRIAQFLILKCLSTATWEVYYSVERIRELWPKGPIQKKTKKTMNTNYKTLPPVMQ